MANSKETRLKFSFKSSLTNESIDKSMIVELTFLSSVSKKYCCSLCQNLLRDPCQVTCCKSTYCRDCVDRLNATTGKCANSKCNKTYSVVGDGPVEDLKKKIRQLKVYCIKRSNGCKWTGTLEQLESTHFRASYNEKDASACQYQTLKCPNDCGALLLRRKVEEHRISECQKEMHVCEYCGMEDSKSHILKVHHRVCPAVPVECPNKCRTRGIARADILNHKEEHCPLRMVHCKYRHVGCSVQVLSKDLQKHNEDSYQLHLDLMSEKLEFVTNENQDLRIENDSLHEEVASLMSKMKDFDSSRDSYIFMDPVRVRPLLTAVPQPMTSLTDGQSQPPEGNESGYGSVTSAASYKRGLERTSEKSRSGTSLGFEDQDSNSSPGYEKSGDGVVISGRAVDEGNVYEDLDDDKFGAFRSMGGGESRGGSCGDVSHASSGHSEGVTHVPLPELPAKPWPLRPPATSIIPDDSQHSTYDVPAKHQASTCDSQTPASSNGGVHMKATRSFSAPSTSELSQSGVYKNIPPLSSIYEDVDKLVEGNDYLDARQNFTPDADPTSVKCEQQMVNPVAPQAHSPASSRARCDVAGKKSETNEAINIPVIQLQSPSKDDPILLALDDDRSNSGTGQGGYENTSKIQRDVRVAAAPQITPRKPRKEAQSTNRNAHDTTSISPTPRSRCSTVGDMRSLKNIKINRKLVDAVKPGTSRVFEDLASTNTPPTGTPAPPPRSSPRPESKPATPPSDLPKNGPKSTELNSPCSESKPAILGEKATNSHSTGSKPTPLPKTGSKYKVSPETETKSQDAPKTASQPASTTNAPLPNSHPKPAALSKTGSKIPVPKPSIEPKATPRANVSKTGSKPSIAPRPTTPKPVSRQRVGTGTGSKSKEAPAEIAPVRKHQPLRSTASLPQNVQPSLIKELTSKLLKDQLAAK